MTARTTIYRVAGTIGADLVTEFEGINLTDRTVTFVMRLQTGGAIEKVANIIDAALGLVNIVWDAGDLVAGTHAAEWKIETPGPPAEVTFFPAEASMAIIVREQV